MTPEDLVEIARRNVAEVERLDRETDKLMRILAGLLVVLGILLFLALPDSLMLRLWAWFGALILVLPTVLKKPPSVNKVE